MGYNSVADTTGLSSFV